MVFDVDGPVEFEVSIGKEPIIRITLYFTYLVSI